MSKLSPARKKWVILGWALVALGLVWLGIRSSLRVPSEEASAPVAAGREPVLQPQPTNLPPPPAPGTVAQPPAGMHSVGVPPGALPTPTPAAPVRAIDLPTLRSELARLREALAGSREPGVLRALIKEFGDLVADAMAQLGAEAVAEELVQTLTSNFTDVDFGLEFGPGEDGRMESVPNWRSLLLDGLAATASPVAADFARASVLDQQRNPADWALGMKIVWRAEGQNPLDPYLHEKLREMFQNRAWVQQPNDALLESFDFVVALHARGMIPQMTGFLGGEVQSGTPFASAIVLQRMAVDDPQVVTAVLAEMNGPIENPDLAKSRASVVARTDPRSGEAAGLIRDYVRNEGASAQEVDYFLRSYPNVNTILTPNIASTQPPPNPQVVAQKQLAALNLITSLAQDPALAAHQNAIREALARLNEQVAAARAAGLL